ncbi:hypothetical protein [Azospirillum himalayense]|uniref:DUF2730 family protein n=1 Tax=Azospirillum himalayense TaxID=654847 RepID=A0ABW0FZV6_9PROT
MVAAPPPKLTEITETPDNRWFAPEKLWAGTHPINQGIAILAAAVVMVVAIQNAGKLKPLVMAYFGRAPREGTSDAPRAFVPPPEPTEADKRNEEVLSILSDMAKKLQRVDQNVHNVVAEVRLLESGVGDLKRRIGDIEGRLTTAVTREEMRIALDLVSELVKAR